MRSAHVLWSINVLPLPTDPDGTPPPLDLSESTKLKDVKFQIGRPRVRWISETLRSARPNTVRQIGLTLYLIFDPTEDIVQEWHELDHLLVQLWTLHSIVPEVTCQHELGELAPNLFPELTSRGAVCISEREK